MFRNFSNLLTQCFDPFISLRSDIFGDEDNDADDVTAQWPLKWVHNNAI